jgi:hypothetical protein
MAPGAPGDLGKTVLLPVTLEWSVVNDHALILCQILVAKIVLENLQSTDCATNNHVQVYIRHCEELRFLCNKMKRF